MKEVSDMTAFFMGLSREKLSRLTPEDLGLLYKMVWLAAHLKVVMEDEISDRLQVNRQAVPSIEWQEKPSSSSSVNDVVLAYQCFADMFTPEEWAPACSITTDKLFKLICKKLKWKMTPANKRASFEIMRKRLKNNLNVKIGVKRSFVPRELNKPWMVKRQNSVARKFNEKGSIGKRRNPPLKDMLKAIEKTKLRTS